MSSCWDNVSVKRGGRIDGANTGAGGLPPVRHPFLFFFPPFTKIRTGLHKFGGNMVNFAFLFEVGHDFFVKMGTVVT